MENVATAACPTDAELAQLSVAVPGQAPAGLARHLAGCTRCQQRVLFGAQPRPPVRARSLPQLPTARQALVLLFAVLVAFVMLLYSVQKLSALFR